MPLREQLVQSHSEAGTDASLVEDLRVFHIACCVVFGLVVLFDDKPSDEIDYVLFREPLLLIEQYI